MLFKFSGHFSKCLSNKTKHDLESKSQRHLDAFAFREPREATEFEDTFNGADALISEK